MPFSDFMPYLLDIQRLLTGCSRIFSVKKHFNFTIIYCKIKLYRLEFLSYYVKHEQQ